MIDTPSTSANQVASSDGLERVAAREKEHRTNRYYQRESTPPQGWGLVSQYMTRVAPHLRYWRGDGWWTAEQALLFDTREDAEIRRGDPDDWEVVWVERSNK